MKIFYAGARYQYFQICDTYQPLFWAIRVSKNIVMQYVPTLSVFVPHKEFDYRTQKYFANKISNS